MSQKPPTLLLGSNTGSPNGSSSTEVLGRLIRVSMIGLRISQLSPNVLPYFPAPWLCYGQRLLLSICDSILHRYPKLLSSMDHASFPPEILKQDKGPQLVVITWVFASLAFVVVSIKTWTRFRILHQSGLEDLFVFLAWVSIDARRRSEKGSSSDCPKVLSLVFGAILTASVQAGLGKHTFAIELDAVVKTIKLYSISMPFGILSVSLPTISLAIILDNITAPTRRRRWLLFSLPALNVIIKITNVILIFTTCPPARTLQDLEPLSRCFSGHVVIDYIYFTTCTSISYSLMYSLLQDTGRLIHF